MSKRVRRQPATVERVWLEPMAIGALVEYTLGGGVLDPIRQVLTNLPVAAPGDPVIPITMVLEYDVKHQGPFAYDYLTSYQRLEPHTPFGHPAEIVSPTAGVTIATPTKTEVATPRPPDAEYAGRGSTRTEFWRAAGLEKLMTLFGETITDIEYPSTSRPLTGDR